jgi:hypothetical protein
MPGPCRGCNENRIAELKRDLGADGFCRRELFATEAAFRSVPLLFNLRAEFQRAADLPGYREPGRAENTDPSAGEPVAPADPNFAEVGSDVRDLRAGDKPGGDSKPAARR